MTEGLERAKMEELWGISIVVKRLRVERVWWCKPHTGMVKLNANGSVRNDNGY